VAVDAGCAAHRLRQVLGADRVDAADPDAGAHQRHQIGPHVVPQRPIQRAARGQRRDAVAEQHLGAVDVADPGEHRLVHQQRGDRDLRA
jgi:hypothetical protein